MDPSLCSSIMDLGCSNLIGQKLDSGKSRVSARPLGEVATVYAYNFLSRRHCGTARWPSGDWACDRLRSPPVGSRFAGPDRSGPYREKVSRFCVQSGSRFRLQIPSSANVHADSWNLTEILRTCTVGHSETCVARWFSINVSLVIKGSRVMGSNMPF